MGIRIFLPFLMIANSAAAEIRSVFLEDLAGARIEIATVEVDETGAYNLTLGEAPFNDHFLSMRPFKCLESPQKHWCYVPYPYEIARNISTELTDLEYDFLFVWKGSNDYGINMWNGVYYKLEEQEGRLVGKLHELDMDVLSAPPEAGELRPLSAKHLHEGDPESHWLPRLVIE